MSLPRLLAVLLPALLLVACGDEPDPKTPGDAPPGKATTTPGSADASGTAGTTDEDGARPEPGRTEFTEASQIPGRWFTTSVPEQMWMVFTEGGRYRYSGVVGSTGGGGGTSVPAAVNENVASAFPWTKPHKGSWTFEDGDLQLLPDDESIRNLMPFEFLKDEGSLNLQVMGRTPQGVQWIVFWQEKQD